MDIEPTKQPLALVLYTCKTCGSCNHKLYELYAPWVEDIKNCSSCRKITLHNRILPDDDNVKNYQRPAHFTDLKYIPQPEIKHKSLDEKEVRKPLPLVKYKCQTKGCCGEQERYELYRTEPAKDIKFCYSCVALTMHTRTVPQEAMKGYYQRPCLF
ncbi:MAG: hypothetical protein V4665_00645 [Patescibacteria group bacterium]